MELADAIVAELGIEHFFNIQLVGELVIEINPRISTVVYQDDLNLPYLGVKRAIGEISEDELRALRSRVRPGGRRCATSTSSSGTRERGRSPPGRAAARSRSATASRRSRNTRARPCGHGRNSQATVLFGHGRERRARAGTHP